MSPKEEVFEVKIGNELKKVKVIHPTSRIEANANMHASRVFGKLVKEHAAGKSSLILRKQLDDFLRESNLYSKEDLEEITKVSKTIDECEKSLMAGGKKSDGKKKAIELRRARYTLLLMLAKKFEYDKNTIEHHSETARLYYIISKCLLDEDGQPIYESPEDFEFDDTELKNDLAEPIRRISAIAGNYDPEYESKLPENKFFKKFNMCDDKFNLVNEEGKLVNENGQLVDENGVVIESEDNKPKEFELGEFSDE